jgi:hypothetical protein
MKIITLGFICLFLVSCASDPIKRKQVAIEESGAMQSTAEPLSSFDNFKLADMTLAPSVQTEPEKVVVAKRLEVKLKTRLDPLIRNWNARSGSVQDGRTVEIQPRVASLRIISGTTRFFAGAFAGQSEISMDLILIDKKTGEEIGRTRVQRAAGAFAGAWSIGMTDRSLLDYIVDISYQYLVDNYKKTE